MYWSHWVTETASNTSRPYDLILRNGTVIDGSGAPRVAADVAVAGARIAAVGAPGSLRQPAHREIDISGRIVAPGFIDSHTHDDNAVLRTPDMTPKLSQGVTTVIVGNCGISLSPLRGEGVMVPPLNLLGDSDSYRFDSMAAYAEAVDAATPSVNVAALVGHMTLRVGCMSALDRRANDAEIAAMRGRLEQALNDGAIGFSTGLYYKPNAAADTDEVVALAEALADADAVYVTHMRNEHDLVADSLAETFEIGRRARSPVVISHHKCAGPRNWGRSKETLALIEAARTGQAVGLDAYPYAAGSTVLDPDMVDETIRIMVSWSHAHPEQAGRDLADIAAAWQCSQRQAAERLAPAGAIYFQMDEADVQRILAYPPTMIGSDGLPHDAHPHPRLWGTFPRVLGHYSRDLGLFSLEQAVHKMTGLPADTFGLRGRGAVREGAWADLVVFDAHSVADTATFEVPESLSSGIDLVITNGVIAWHDGERTGARGGRFIRRQQ